jgi:hypothetical protein
LCELQKKHSCLAGGLRAEWVGTIRPQTSSPWTDHDSILTWCGWPQVYKRLNPIVIVTLQWNATGLFDKCWSCFIKDSFALIVQLVPECIEFCSLLHGKAPGCKKMQKLIPEGTSWKLNAKSALHFPYWLGCSKDVGKIFSPQLIAPKLVFVNIVQIWVQANKKSCSKIKQSCSQSKLNSIHFSEFVQKSFLRTKFGHEKACKKRLKRYYGLVWSLSTCSEILIERLVFQW